jgi:hypothetical protein
MAIREKGGEVTTLLKRICLSILLAASLAANGIAEAGQAKYIYLKVGEGEAHQPMLSNQNRPAKRRYGSTMQTGPT